MAIIVNSAWKSQKDGAIVKFKGEEYEIGSDAFGSLEAAVAAGETSDLVIVDKKLTSPVKKENITGAATDIFASTVKETESKDGKTYTKTVKFTAAAGGTASFKDDDAELIGFEKVTATAAGGSFQGGKVDISSSAKEVDDYDKGIQSADKSVTVASTATGSLTVNGKAAGPSVSVAAIADSEGATDEAIDIVKEAYKAASGEDYEEGASATYASVTVKDADVSTAINGGAVSEKATIKTSDTNGEKINEEYTYSGSSKVGSGTATLTNANAGAISGFKTVKVSTSTAKTIGGDIEAGNSSSDYSVKSAYVADQSFSYTKTEKKTESSSGTLNIAGKTGNLVTVSGEIEGFSSMNLKFATVNKEINSGSETKNSSLSFAVKNQKDVDSLTASYSIDKSNTADGSLTAANSTLVGIKGVKSVTISGNYNFAGGPTDVDATNTKVKATRKETGVAKAGISDKASDYVDNFETNYTLAAFDSMDAGLVEDDQAYTFEVSKKIENAAGGTTFKVSGKAAADTTVNVNGYKTVNVDNTDDTNRLTADLSNNSNVTDFQKKVSYTPESSYSSTSKTTTTDKAFGDATIKGRTTASAVKFAGVKVSGKADVTILNGVDGQNTSSSTDTQSTTIKNGKENAVGSYTRTTAGSRKAASTLDVNTATIQGGYDALKTVKMQKVKSAGNITFNGADDSDRKTSVKKDWNAGEISAAEADKGAGLAITDAEITAWNQTFDSKTSAVATFSVKNGAEAFTATANGFKSVDVSGANTKLNGVTGTDTVTDKWSKSLSVNATKGTYNGSSTRSAQAVTTVNVSNAKIGTTFNSVKNVSLTNAAADAAATFNASSDTDTKSSLKFDWNAEEATYNDIMTPGPDPDMENSAITSWTESDESKTSASGTFTLKNNSTTAATVTANGFKSVTVTGAKDQTVLNGAAGQDTVTRKSSKSLSVSKGKGTYSDSDADTAKAATALTVTTANIQGDFTNLKSVDLKDIKVADATTFTASLDTDSKSSLKFEWDAEAATYGDIMGIAAAQRPFDENVTSWSETSENKSSVVGTFSLENAENGGSALSIDNFKSVKISGTVDDFNAASLANNGDHTDKSSLKRTASETKRAQEYSWSSTDKAVGTLELVGMKDNTLVLTLANGKTVGYSNITLNYAQITTAGAISAASYDENQSISVKESVSLDSGSPVTVDLKVSASHSKKGNGSFSAKAGAKLLAFNGTLKGYNSISLKDTISIGNVDNYKYEGGDEGGWDTYKVPFNGEYFDVVAVVYGAEAAPGDAEDLQGNISGSYTMDKNGQITSKWTGSYAKTANGSFTQTATVAELEAGNISGYDKVELKGVKTIGNIDGINISRSTVLNYKYANDEDEANSKVVTDSTTSSSSVLVEGKDIDGMQTATATSIQGYKTVTLKNAKVTDVVSAVNMKTVTTTDKVNSPDNDDVRVTSESVGTLRVTSSQLVGAVTGFKTVELKDTVGANTVDFTAGDSYTDTLGVQIANTQSATGSFTTSSTEEAADLYSVRTVGDITGYAKVTLQDTNADAVSVGFAQDTAAVRATSFEIIAENEEKETPKTWKKAGSTKGNSFSATADYKVVTDVITTNGIEIASVKGYGKVEAAYLDSIGTIENAFIQDSVAGFGARIYGNKHYGDWTATATEAETQYTKIEVAAGSTVKINGVVAKNGAGEVVDTAETDVTGNIAGYSTVKLDTVRLGAGAAVTYAGGKYNYTATTNKDDEVIATSTSTADGRLEISNATFVADTTFAVEGFKAVAIDIGGAAVFTKIIGGTEVAQFTDGTLNYTTFKASDKLSVTTGAGSVTGKVAGFATMEFTNTNLGAGAAIMGYDIGTKKEDGEIVQTETARVTVTFDDTDATTNTFNATSSIINAQKIVFKSKADTGDADFQISGTVTSNKGDLTIEIDKSQVEITDLAKFTLDEGDVINMISAGGPGEAAELDLGVFADAEALADKIANIHDVAFTGAGDIVFGTISADVFATTLKANNITWGADITFNGVHHD